MAETADFDICLSVKLYRCSNIVKKQLLLVILCICVIGIHCVYSLLNYF